MKSNWQSAKETSKYHFDPMQAGSSYDAAPKLGKFAGNSWHEETKQVITSSVPATWATRGYKHKGDVSPDIAAEEYDLTSAGAPADLVICRMEWDIPPTIQKMADAFGLDDLYCRIHVQFAGEVFNMHIDKLQKWNLYLVHLRSQLLHHDRQQCRMLQRDLNLCRRDLLL